MKTLALALLCALTLPVMAALGDVVAKEELPIEWFAGEKPQAWPTDDLWVFECWTTWCGPCLRAIPHMEQLWNTVKGGNIHIAGVNLQRDKTPENLREFFIRQPIPPTYSMAIDTDNRFAQKMKIIGIPHAVIIRNGKVVWQGHPMSLKPETLRELAAPAAACEAATEKKAPCTCPKCTAKAQ